MSGYRTYLKYQRIEEQAAKFGFRIGQPKSYSADYDRVSIYPDQDCLPVFSRDAELYTGTFDEIENWLAGWAMAQQYDRYLRLTDEKKRKKAEDRERERQRLEKERLEKRKMYAILANKQEAEVDNLVKVSK